ncbi:MAG: PQQ-binding-like beta-propeller repeat protein [Candidatus Aegiribacteria sp.]|nr:PQQ-binding-like beta-propeller repeat protein [Candidatus Aegiribacteria sp.]
MILESHIQTENDTHIIENRGNRQNMIIGITLIFTLIILFLFSTVFYSTGGNGKPDEVLQVLHGDSTQIDSLIPPDTVSVAAELPDLWLQARGYSHGNAAWGPDIIAPFDTLWQLRSNGGREFFSSPAIRENVLYFGCNDGLLRAVNALNGAVLWSFSTVCGICGEPAVDSTSVYFGGQDGIIYALDRISGSKRWSAGLGYHVFCSVGILADSLILSGNSMGKICALRASDGELLWDSEIGGTVLGPAIIDSLAVFSSENGKIAVFNTEGNRLWIREYGRQASSPSADSTGIYAGFSDGSVRKLTITGGELIWETDIVEGSSRCVLARPVIAGNNIVLIGTNDGRLVALNSSTGSLLWEQEFENWLQLSPIAGDNCIYVPCDDQRLHLLDLNTGAKLDSLEMNGYSGTAPLLANSILYYGNSSGDFIAITGTVEIEEEIEEISLEIIPETEVTDQ